MFRKRRPRVVQSFNTAALRDAADHLSGWTYSGSGDLSRFKEPPTLLRNAANEIERSRAAAAVVWGGGVSVSTPERPEDVIRVAITKLASRHEFLHGKQEFVDDALAAVVELVAQRDALAEALANLDECLTDAFNDPATDEYAAPDFLACSHLRAQAARAAVGETPT